MISFNSGHHFGRSPLELMGDIEGRLIPALLKEMSKRGHVGYSAHIEMLGDTVNIVLSKNGYLVSEFAIGLDDKGPYWMPVYYM